MSVTSTINTNTFTPLNNKVFVSEFDRGMKMTKSGIILTDDDMKDHGIHPRWAKVYSVGPKVDDLAPGEWVLVAHGRWSQRIPFRDDEGKTTDLWQVEYPEGILLVSENDPRDGDRFVAGK